MRRRLSPPALGSVVMALSLLASACGSTSSSTTVPRAVTATPYRYVAVGGTDATGASTGDPLLDAWPQQLFRTSMPLSAVLVNAAVPQETVARALSDQVPTAVASSPTVVTVWLVSGDLLDGTLPSAYAADLLRLLTALRDRGRTTVLVANAPPLDQVPGYPACRDGAGGRRLTCPLPLPDAAALEERLVAYDTAVATDAAISGAVIVDLHDVVARSVISGAAAFLDANGADLSTAGSTVVAAAFGAALRAAGPRPVTGTRRTAG